MAHAENAGAPRPLFVYGCPRSGTTWMQLLLHQHPLVATAPETQVFSYYMNNLRRQWREDAKNSRRSAAGLRRLLTDDEFRTMCRMISDFVLEKISQANPAARVVVEKSPQHARHARWIADLYPEALFLHVIRDPRDTVSSLIAAAKSWTRSWSGAEHPLEAARYWVRHVTAGRALLGRASYREVRYERLRKDPEAELQAILEWTGLPADRELCRTAVENCRLERLQRTAGKARLPTPMAAPPSGFFRRGRVGGWQRDFSPGTVRIIEHVCGELMDELGYDRTTDLRTTDRGRVFVHDALSRVRESIDWQLQRLLRRI